MFLAVVVRVCNDGFHLWPSTVIYDTIMLPADTNIADYQIDNVQTIRPSIGMLYRHAMSDLRRCAVSIII